MYSSQSKDGMYMFLSITFAYLQFELCHKEYVERTSIPILVTVFVCDRADRNRARRRKNWYFLITLMCQGDIQDVLPVRGQENYGKTVWASRIEAGTQGKLQNSFFYLWLAKFNKGQNCQNLLVIVFFQLVMTFYLEQNCYTKKRYTYFLLITAKS